MKTEEKLFPFHATILWIKKIYSIHNNIPLLDATSYIQQILVANTFYIASETRLLEKECVI